MKRNFIAFAVISLILGLMISLQYKSNLSSPTSFYPDRWTEVVIQTEQLKNQHDALVNEIDFLRYKLNYSDAAAKARAVEEMLNKAKIASGATAVAGPGIVLTLDDDSGSAQPNNTGYYVLQYWNLLELINELNAAGAECISINGERIAAGTQICGKQTGILVNRVPVKSPYEIRAIGDVQTLESSLNLKGGEIQALLISGIKVDMQKSDKVEIPAYSRRSTFQYAVPVS